nr:molybdate ABC transporter permease subunit [Armatimonadota bacterium]
RALGEFGATLMVAGSIPGQTQTLPLALYAAVQAGHDREARVYTLVLSAAALVLTGSVSAYERRLAVNRGDR